jgi:c-di-GMP-related signal transduction protein
VKADFLLVDMLKLETADERETMNGQSDGKIALIARGVNSWAEHQRARKLGFSFFQRDFFLTRQLFRRTFRHAAQRGAPAARVDRCRDE